MPSTACLSAYVGGFSLNETRTDGTEVYVLSIDGWEEGADLDVDRIRRSRAGEFAQPGKPVGRVVTIEGRAKSPDHISSMRLRREIGALLADGGFAELVMEHRADLQLWATVQRLSRPQFTQYTPKFFDWRLTFLAADHLLYGLASTATTGFATSPEGAGLVFPLFDPDGVLDFGAVPTSDGTVTISNDGNAPAYPVFSIDGPTPPGGFRIVELSTGRRITFLGDVPAGSSLVMDSSDGSVVINGGPSRLGDTIVSRWPSIPAHSSATYLFAPESSSSAAVLTASAYSTYY